MKKLRVYEYANCSTCKKALKYLDGRKIAYERVSITEQPPGVPELKRMLGHLERKGLGLKKLFNTSGQVYREQGISEKLPNLTETQALKLLAANGKLIKRPFLLLEDDGVIGFQESEWKKTLQT